MSAHAGSAFDPFATFGLQAGQGCLVPAGAWHRLILGQPCVLLFITPAHGPRHRPVGAASTDG